MRTKIKEEIFYEKIEACPLCGAQASVITGTEGILKVHCSKCSYFIDTIVAKRSKK